MASVYNEVEKNALSKKEDNPKEEVVCPRCGKKLLYWEYGNSSQVKCETPNCIVRTRRGI